MSMWAEYFREKDGKECVETTQGFMLYSFKGEECYIEHVYVVPEARKEGHGKFLLSVVEARARKNGCKYLTGSIRPSARGSTESALAQMACGFKILSAHQDAIYLVKNLEDAATMEKGA